MFLALFMLLVLNCFAIPGPAAATGSLLSGNDTLPKQSRKTVYLISGLGADERLYRNLTLPPEFIYRHVAWMEPYKRESMNSYCRRLATQIDTSSAFVLVGLSFGGMVAIEMNKFLKPEKTILISSIVTEAGLSKFFRIVHKLSLHQIVPTWLYKNFHPGAYWFFDARNKEQRKLTKELMESASKNLLKWSVNRLVGWQNQFQPQNVYLINGDDDRVFPYKRTNTNKVVKGGGHMMVYNKAEEMSKILTEELRRK